MNNIKKIQEKLIEKNLDAVLVTDEKNQRYATGFPFTDGAVIVARFRRVAHHGLPLYRGCGPTPPPAAAMCRCSTASTAASR